LLKNITQQLNELFTLRGIKSQIVGCVVGPTFTRYEASVDPFNFRMDVFVALEDNIAHLAQAPAPPIIYPIYEKSVVAIDIINNERQRVDFTTLLSKVKDVSHLKVPMMLGSSVQGEPYIIDLIEAPHVLVAGTTGSGKSVSLRSMLASMIYLNRSNIQLILIDPKAVELSIFESLNIAEVITDIEQVEGLLVFVQQQVETRYQMMHHAGVSNVADIKGLPYLILVIDELADLVQHKRTINEGLQKIVQKSRAAGVHVIAATQRPSVDVVSGVIKNNFPTRIAFKVASQDDSRTILSSGGAEKLLGQGDMIYHQSANSFERLQGPLITNQQIKTLLGELPPSFRRAEK